MNFVSDSSPLDDEIEEYKECMSQIGLPSLLKHEVIMMKETQMNPWVDHLLCKEITNDDVYANYALYKAMTIPKDRLIEWCNDSFFEQYVRNFYVQVAVGKDPTTQKPLCRLSRIQAVEAIEKEYYEIYTADPVDSSVRV